LYPDEKPTHKANLRIKQGLDRHCSEKLTLLLGSSNQQSPSGSMQPLMPLSKQKYLILSHFLTSSVGK